MAELVRYLISNGFAFVEDGGFFIGVMSQHFFGYDCFTTDLALYVEKEKRGTEIAMSLIMEYIKEAKELGISDIRIGNSTGNVGGLYERCGFTHVGGVYVYRS